MCSTMSYQQSAFLVACFGIFTIFSFCHCSDLTDGNEYLQKVENTKQNVNKMAALLAEELLKEDNPQPVGREKRVFCNGFFGCSNGRKRSQSGSLGIAPFNYPIVEPAEELMKEDNPPPAGREKRVFCNEIFGCSNGGKRSQSGSLDIAPLNYPIDEPEVQPSFRKRLFCNQGGCFGKRSGRFRRFLENLEKAGNLKD